VRKYEKSYKVGNDYIVKKDENAIEKKYRKEDENKKGCLN
jgi:hypothetical protein